LDWYQEYFVNTTKKIDYGIKNVSKKGLLGGKTKVTLERVELMPMPLDVKVTFEDGNSVIYYIPLDIMRGAKAHDDKLYEGSSYELLTDWNWVNTEYTFIINSSKKKIAKIELNPSGKMADVVLENNVYVKN
jgi:hypothetical protein